MNYVRKLGFEEAPDYNFLRDLFLKVLKNIGETDDRMFDWCLLNNGKGWEYGSVSELVIFRFTYCADFSSVRRGRTLQRCRLRSIVSIATVSIDNAPLALLMALRRLKLAQMVHRLS